MHDSTDDSAAAGVPYHFARGVVNGVKAVFAVMGVLILEVGLKALLGGLSGSRNEFDYSSHIPAGQKRIYFLLAVLLTLVLIGLGGWLGFRRAEFKGALVGVAAGYVCGCIFGGVLLEFAGNKK